MSPARVTVCPSCKLAVLEPKQNPCFPFCSERCRAIDLSRWLNEDYRFVSESADDDDDGDASPAKNRVPEIPDA